MNPRKTYVKPIRVLERWHGSRRCDIILRLAAEQIPILESLGLIYSPSSEIARAWDAVCETNTYPYYRYEVPDEFRILSPYIPLQRYDHPRQTVSSRRDVIMLSLKERKVIELVGTNISRVRTLGALQHPSTMFDEAISRFHDVSTVLPRGVRVHWLGLRRAV